MRMYETGTIVTERADFFSGCFAMSVFMVLQEVPESITMSAPTPLITTGMLQQPSSAYAYSSV